MLIILMVAAFLFRAIYFIKNPDVKTVRLAEDLRRMFGAPLVMMVSGIIPDIRSGGRFPPLVAGAPDRDYVQGVHGWV